MNIYVVGLILGAGMILGGLLRGAWHGFDFFWRIRSWFHYATRRAWNWIATAGLVAAVIMFLKLKGGA